MPSRAVVRLEAPEGEHRLIADEIEIFGRRHAYRLGQHLTKIVLRAIFCCSVEARAIGVEASLDLALHGLEALLLLGRHVDPAARLADAVRDPTDAVAVAVDVGPRKIVGVARPQLVRERHADLLIAAMDRLVEGAQGRKALGRLQA